MSSRGSILIVEDDRDIRESLSEVLDAEGWRVRQAADGFEALACLELPPSPDLILLDLIMPKMDGWEFRTAQQQDPILAKIPVVLITAVPEGTESLQAAGCVRKPVQLSRLLEAVEQAR